MQEENQCYSEKLLNEIVTKRVTAKEACFRHLHPEIVPMLSRLKEKGLLVGLISNNELLVKAEECIYVGDGGSNELEAARKLGMKAVQAAWYLQEGTTQTSRRQQGFPQLERPLDVLKFI